MSKTEQRKRPPRTGAIFAMANSLPTDGKLPRAMRKPKPLQKISSLQECMDYVVGAMHRNARIKGISAQQAAREFLEWPHPELPRGQPQNLSHGLAGALASMDAGLTRDTEEYMALHMWVSQQLDKDAIPFIRKALRFHGKAKGAYGPLKKMLVDVITLMLKQGRRPENFTPLRLWDALTQKPPKGWTLRGNAGDPDSTISNAERSWTYKRFANALIEVKHDLRIG